MYKLIIFVTKQHFSRRDKILLLLFIEGWAPKLEFWIYSHLLYVNDDDGLMIDFVTIHPIHTLKY